MSVFHIAVCDQCETQAKTEYTGEHWIPPRGWAKLVLESSLQDTGLHICPNCVESLKERGKKS